MGRYIFQMLVWLCTIPSICLIGFGEEEIRRLLKHFITKTNYKGILFLMGICLIQLPVAYWGGLLSIFFWVFCMMYQSIYMHEIHTIKYIRGLGSLLFYVLCNLFLDWIYFPHFSRDMWKEIIVVFVPVEILIIFLFYLVALAGKRKKWSFLLVYIEIMNVIQFMIVHNGIMQKKIDSWMWLVFVGILGNVITEYILLIKVGKENWQEDILSNTVISDEEVYEYYLRLDEAQVEVRKMYHDMKNYLVIFEDNLKEKENQELRSYLNDFKNTLSNVEGFISSGHRELDIFLHKKKIYAKEQRIDLDITIEKECLNGIPAKTLMSFFSNAINNSLEACMKLETDKRKIEVKAMRIDNKVMIFIKNPISLEMENQFETQKKNKKMHGLGMLNMKEAIEKSGGLLFIENEKGFFQVSALFELA